MSACQRLFAALAAISWLMPCLADTVYVRDTLYVPVRGGQSVEHRILHQGLRSGTKVERLEINDESGFSRIRTDRGLEGWVQSQYLVEQPIAAFQLEGVTAKLHALQAEYQQAQEIMRKQSKINDTSSARIVAMEKTTNSLKKELSRITELAANVIAIDQQNEQLENERDVLFQRIDELTESIHALEDTSKRGWFLLGAGAILLGLLFGFWVGRKIYFQKNSGWS